MYIFDIAEQANHENALFCMNIYFYTTVHF